MRVCIIDDDAHLLAHLEQTVSQFGFYAFPAATVDQAIEIISESNIDAVLVDILMPERDGLELIMAIRGLVPRLRIVAMSGGGRMGSGSVLAMASGLGADAILTKPFSASELHMKLVESSADTPPKQAIY